MSEEITTVDTIIDEVVVYEKLKTAYPEKETLIELAQDYRGLVVTEETFEQAKKARMVLRQPRYDIRNKEKEITSVLNNIKARSKKIADDLIGIIQPIENEIDIEIKSIEAKKEAERAERERIKAAQMAEWLEKAQSILAYADMVVSVKTLPEAQELLKEVSCIVISEDEYGAYELIARQNLDKSIGIIESAIVSLEEAEKAKIELEAKQLSDARQAYLEYFRQMNETLTTHELLKAIEDDKTAKLRRLEELERAEEQRLKLEKIEQQKMAEYEAKHTELVDEYAELFGETFRGLAKGMPNEEIRRIIDEELAKKYPEIQDQPTTATVDACVEYTGQDDQDWDAYNEAIDNVVNHLANVKQEVNGDDVKKRIDAAMNYLTGIKWNA